MSDARISKGIYLAIAAISLALTIVLLIFANMWFWVGLPFFLTSTVLALDVI